jgi:3-oxoacyl-[acyl-carrier-protein] synthase II
MRVFLDVVLFAMNLYLLLLADGLREQWLPPESALETADPICQFQIVREPADAKVSVTLSNSFGFGGANATLVLRRWS